MAFKLDYETDSVEGITIKQKEKYCDIFVKNMRHFGWQLVLKNSVTVYDDNGRAYADSDLYRVTLERRKDLLNYDSLCNLEEEFCNISGQINFRAEALVGVGDKVNPNYIDYESDEPIMPVYKLSVGRAVFNTVMCFAIIGFLMWIETVFKLLKNKKARKIAELKDKIRDIFRRADKLD